MFANVNLTAVLAASVASFIVGFVWYHPKVLGERWRKLVGLSKKQLESGNMVMGMGLGFLATLVTAYILAGFLQGSAQPYMTAFYLWLGFIGATTIDRVSWEQSPWGLWLLNNAWKLVSLLVMTAVLTAM